MIRKHSCNSYLIFLCTITCTVSPSYITGAVLLWWCPPFSSFFYQQIRIAFELVVSGWYIILVGIKMAHTVHLRLVWEYIMSIQGDPAMNDPAKNPFDNIQLAAWRSKFRKPTLILIWHFISCHLLISSPTDCGTGSLFRFLRKKILHFDSHWLWSVVIVTARCMISESKQKALPMHAKRYRSKTLWDKV